MNYAKHLTRGDIVRNEWASDDNPQKILLVLHVTAKRVYCLGLDDSFPHYYDNNADLRMTKIDTVDLTPWRRLAKNQYEHNPLNSRVECVGCGADYTEKHL